MTDRTADLEAEVEHARTIAAISIGQPDRAQNLAYREEMESKLRAARAAAVEKAEVPTTDRIETVIATQFAADEGDPNNVTERHRNMAKGALAALKAARIAVVELPDAVTVEDYGLSVTPAHSSVFGLPIAEEVSADKGMTRTRWRSVSEARTYAAALLAAADAAEASQ